MIKNPTSCFPLVLLATAAMPASLCLAEASAWMPATLAAVGSAPESTSYRVRGADSLVLGEPPQPETPATPTGPATATDPWRVDFKSWIWLVGMEGTVGARGLQAEVSSSFGDILEASDSIFAFSGRLEVGKGAWGAFVDGMYSKLGTDDQTGPGGVADVDITFQMVLLDFGLMYRLGEWEPSGESAKNTRNITLDLYAGARYTNLDLELDPAVLPDRSQSVTWFDPIIGAKVVLPVAERWSVTVNGDVGGFGASSDFTWSMTGVIGFDFHIGELPATLHAGYRALGQDYSKGSGANEFTWDVVQHGPIIGLSLLF